MASVGLIFLCLWLRSDLDCLQHCWTIIWFRYIRHVNNKVAKWQGQAYSYTCLLQALSKRIGFNSLPASGSEFFFVCCFWNAYLYSFMNGLCALRWIAGQIIFINLLLVIWDLPDHLSWNVIFQCAIMCFVNIWHAKNKVEKCCMEEYSCICLLQALKKDWI